MRHSSLSLTGWNPNARPPHRPVWLGLLVLMGPVATRPASAGSTIGWPLCRNDPQQRAFVELQTEPTTPPHAWTFAPSDRRLSYQPGMTVWTSPAIGVVDGHAILVAGSYDHNIYALNASAGTLRWQMTTGGGVYAGPVLWSDGNQLWVFAGSSDRLLYALDADTGERRWIHSVASYRSTLGGARLSSPAVGRAGEQMAVFVGHWVWDQSLTHNSQEGGVTAVDARTGNRIWKQSLGDNEITSPIYVAHGAYRWLWVGSANGNLYALDANTGQLRWQQTELDALRSPPAFAQAPAGPVVVMASKFGLVRCLHAGTGEQLWSYKTGDWVTGTPVIAEVGGRSLVLVGSYDRSLYALDLFTGTLVWRYFARGGIFSGPALLPTARGPRVLVSAWDHHLHVVDAKTGTALSTRYTGRPLWQAIGLEQSNWASPAVAKINGVGMAYVGSYNGTLYALTETDLIASHALGQKANLSFWLSFPIVLLAVGIGARTLTSFRRGRAPPPSERPNGQPLEIN